MKRDMDMVRNVLLFMEQSDDHAFIFQEIAEGVEGEPDAIIAHVVMLRSAGFLEESQRGVVRITWAGHEFLDTIRDPEIWRKTKTGAEKLGSWSVKLLAELATGYIRMKAAELGLPVAT